MNIVASTQNKYFKQLKEMAKAKPNQPFFLVEGIKQIDELTKDWEIKTIAVSESFAVQKDVNALAFNTELNILTDRLFKLISDTISPQGILAVCVKKKAYGEIDFSKPGGLYLICDRISDPGNMGTIIRNAHAFGCDGLLISRNSVDIYNPKIIRASAGSIFRTAFSIGIDLRVCIEELRANGVRIITTHPRGDRLLGEVDFSQKSALVIGNEATGVTDLLTEYTDVLARIPMPGNSESLNASVACGIALYEAVRQRNAQPCSVVNDTQKHNKIII